MARRIARTASRQGVSTSDSAVRTIPGRSRRATGSGDAAPEAPAARVAPTHEQIAARAYEIYLARGAEPGHAEQDWLQAERELTKER